MNRKIAPTTMKIFDLNGNSLWIRSNPESTALTEESGVKGLTGFNSEVLLNGHLANHCWPGTCLIQDGPSETEPMSMWHLKDC